MFKTDLMTSFLLLLSFQFPVTLRKNFFRLKQIYCKFQNKRIKISIRCCSVATQEAFVFNHLCILGREIKTFVFKWKNYINCRKKSLISSSVMDQFTFIFQVRKEIKYRWLCITSNFSIFNKTEDSSILTTGSPLWKRSVFKN